MGHFLHLHRVICQVVSCHTSCDRFMQRRQSYLLAELEIGMLAQESSHFSSEVAFSCLQQGGKEEPTVLSRACCIPLVNS